MRNAKLIFIILSSFATNFMSFGQVIVGGTILTSTTWMKINSPYLVQSTVTVGTAVVLTIEPGVLVEFSNNVGLEINGGKLIASGNQNDSIIFKSATTSPFGPRWDGISMQGWEQTFIEYCSIEDAETGINSNISGASITTILNCTFKDCSTGLATNLANNQGLVDYCKFIGNEYGVYYRGGLMIDHSYFFQNFRGVFGYDVLKIENCEISNSYDISVMLDVDDTLFNCVLMNNNTAIYSSDGFISGNIIENNVVGIDLGCGMHSISCNRFCNNTNYAVQYSCQFFNGDIRHNDWCGLNSTLIPPLIYDGNDVSGIATLYFNPIDNVQCYLTSKTEELVNDNFFSLYPNPCTSQISVSTFSKQKILITDQTGKIVFVLEPNKNNFEFKLETSTLISGLYIVSQGEFHQKFIKQ